MSPGVQLLESLALVAGGGIVTVAAQTLADKRARRAALRDAHDVQVADELERIRGELRDQEQELARMRGFIEGRDSTP